VRVLAVNAGSSSLKLTLVDARDAVVQACELPAPGAGVDREELARALRSPLARADAVGHRVVHGGERFREPVRLDTRVRAQLAELCELAPLHQPKSLAVVDLVAEALPDVPAVACFDTAFHATLPAAAATYALPARMRERWPLRRYGFHGLSHSWVARRAPGLLGRDASELRIVSCHLGAGASLCAIASGGSLDTTMGFTPLAGLVMATRCGDVDPGLLLWLLERERVAPAALADALEHESGLLGLAGSADMGEITRRADAGDQSAQLALDVYVHRLCGAVAAMAAALGGLDALAFTGGVGERSARVRARAARSLAFLGVSIDEGANAAASSVDAELSTPGAAVRTLVLRAREDLEIARQTRLALGAAAA
jgi:acetate kinase